MKMIRTTLAGAAALLLVATAAAADTLVEKLDKTYPLQGKTVSVENVNGSVDVGVWDRNEVRVEAEKRVRGARRDSSDEALKAVRIEVSQTATGLEIRTRYPKHDGVSGIFNFFTEERLHAEVKYTITMPRTAKLEVDSVNAAVRVNGVQGGSEIETVNGSIEVVGAAGSFEAETVNGSIDAELSSVAAGKLSAETVNGRVRLALPAALRANVAIETVNGKITTDIPVTTRSLSKRALRGSMNGGGPVDLAITTVNGSVTIEPNS